MKVFFDSQIFNAQVHGGISRYFTRLIEKLKSTQHLKARIGGPSFINEYLSESSLIGVSRGYQVHKMFKHPSRLLSHIACHLDLIFNDYSIVHKTYYYPEMYRTKGAVVILTVYDMIHEIYPTDQKNTLTLSRRKRRAVEKADHIICISKNTKKDLVDIFGVKEQSVSVIYLGFDDFSTKNVEVNHSSVVEDFDEKFLLYVGGRTGHKNFKRFIEAFSLSSLLKRNYRIICFGGGSFSDEEKAFFEDLQVSDRIKQVSGADDILANFYRNAELFVYPSLYEGFGIPPLEAMSVGCPVAASNASSIPEVCGQAVKYFNPSDVQSIRDALEYVLSNSVYSEGLVVLGYEQCAKFSWEKCGKDTLDLYTSVLENSNRRISC
ncbi:glycosyltransferase family 4 protein [Pseudomonadales bacterium]|nr:glycosyltransferase family 4 protein [Pseudomonadales bacterium]